MGRNIPYGFYYREDCDKFFEVDLEIYSKILTSINSYSFSDKFLWGALTTTVYNSKKKVLEVMYHILAPTHSYLKYLRLRGGAVNLPCVKFDPNADMRIICTHLGLTLSPFTGCVIEELPPPADLKI